MMTQSTPTSKRHQHQLFQPHQHSHQQRQQSPQCPPQHPQESQQQFNNNNKIKRRPPLSLIKTTMVLSGISCILITSIQLHVHSDLHSKHSSLKHFNDNDDDGISGIVNLDGSDDHYDNMNIHTNMNNNSENASISTSSNSNTSSNANNVINNGVDQNQQNATDKSAVVLRDEHGQRQVDDTNISGENDSTNHENTLSKETKTTNGAEPNKTTNNKNNNNSKRNINSDSNPNVSTNTNTNTNTNIDCGCPASCTNDALEISNSNFNCKARITKLMSRYNFSQEQACATASKSSIDDTDEDEIRPCPLYCNPNVCHTMDGSTIEQLKSKEKQQKQQQQQIDCGCPETCTKRALQKRNPNFLCLDRIQHLMTKYNVPEEEACEAASQTEFVYTSGDVDKVDVNLNKPCEYECHPKLCTSTKVSEDVIATLNLPKSFTAATSSNTSTTTTTTTTTNDTNATDATNTSTATTTTTTQSSYHKYDKVVIVTKVLSAENIDLLIQMLCLFHAAYNRFVNYDIIVFTTIPFTEDEIQSVRDVVAPHTSLDVVPEGPSLEDHLANMTQSEITALYERCNVKPNETSITWSHHCSEENTPHVFNLGYAWQAEFRSYHLWTHPALQEYKYMMWLDADAMCTKTWEDDPMRVMVENDLVLMFDQFPGGYVRGDVLRQKMEAAYGNGHRSSSHSDNSDGGDSNRTDGVICKVELDMEKGVLTREFCADDGGVRSMPSIRQVYGFHHITNLDIYRKEKHQRFLRELINNEYKFSRLWDDQLAVTLPAVMEDPDRCWDYRLNGLNVGIHHNGRIDGKEHPEYLSYLNFWAHHGKYDWPAARAMCDGLVTSIG